VSSRLGSSVSTWAAGSPAAPQEKWRKKNATTAVVTALAPICVDKFQHSAEAASNLTELKKVSSWQQGSFISKGGWGNAAR
jgi:hypothetical protein